jgi:NAD(P)-dependent dehydrogenase (short-subunit alcohol dehydrogenase family)
VKRRRFVLVTDADHALGRTIALKLAHAGHRVMAGGCDVDGLSDLPRETYARGLVEICPLDTSSAESCRSAVIAARDRLGRLDALVWAGGRVSFGPVEEEDEEDAKASIEANLHAPWRMLRAALPFLREEPGCLILAVSSAAGRVALPLGGAYSASRFALEGLCDALRLEVAGFGIDVSLVEPGLLRDRVHDLRTERLSGKSLFGVESTSPYAALARALTRGYQQLMGKAATHDQVADVVDRALRAKRPKARYAVKPGTAAVMLARRILPARMLDRRFAKEVRKRSSS